MYLLTTAASLGFAIFIATLGDLRLAWLPLVIAAMAWGSCAGMSAWAVRRRSDLPMAILIAGLGCRLALLFSEPTLSDDLFRYLWEGRVLLAGENPFLHAPASEALSSLRDPLWEQVGHKEVSTIYPPGALLFFQLVSWSGLGPLGWKLLSALADVGVLLLIIRIARDRGVGAWAPALYALLPLPVLESAGSGHLEPLALLGWVGAIHLWDRNRDGLAVALASLGALVKLLPAALLLPLLRRSPRSLLAGVPVAVLALVVLFPLLGAGETLGRGFGRYFSAWAFNAPLFPLLERGFGEHARLVGVAIGALWCGRAALICRDPARLGLHVAGALILLSPVVHPWYVLWVFTAALCRGVWPWAVLALTAPLSYAVLGSYDPLTNSWSEPAWVVPIEYGIPALAGVWWARSTLQKRRSTDAA